MTYGMGVKWQMYKEGQLQHQYQLLSEPKGQLITQILGRLLRKTKD